MTRNIGYTVLLFCYCLAANASNTTWAWRFSGSAYFGTDPAASDDLDVLDQRITDPSKAWYCGTYHEQGIDGWSGDTGFYSIDTRSPLPLIAGESKVWTFYLWENPDGNIVLELTWGWMQPAPAFDKIRYTLTYVRAAQGITGGPVPVGTSVILNQYQQGTWSFPVYKTTDGRTGYMFELTATVIPEPAPLASLGLGVLLLGSMGRIAMKRRG